VNFEKRMRVLWGGKALGSNHMQQRNGEKKLWSEGEVQKKGCKMNTQKTGKGGWTIKCTSVENSTKSWGENEDVVTRQKACKEGCDHAARGN